AQLERDWEHHLPTVREEYQRRVAGGRDRINRLIEPCRGVHPTAPEPVQVSSRYVLEGPEEIRGLRMLERPAPHVLSQGALERLLSERSEEHTSELQSRGHLVCRLLLEKKNNNSHPDQ